MGTLASVEDDSTMQPGHPDCIDFTFNCSEGRFRYDGGTLSHDATGFQPEDGSVSIFIFPTKKPLTLHYFVDQSATVTTENMTANDAYLAGLTPTDATTLASAAASPLTSDRGIYTDSLNFGSRSFL